MICGVGVGVDKVLEEMLVYQGSSGGCEEVAVKVAVVILYW